MVILGLCCLGLLAPNLASAKGAKLTKEERTAAKAILAKYDANSNGKLDPDEIDKLKADYAAGNEADAKVFDTNNDGKLDDGEVAVIEKAVKPHKKKSQAGADAGSSTNNVPN